MGLKTYVPDISITTPGFVGLKIYVPDISITTPGFVGLKTYVPDISITTPGFVGLKIYVPDISIITLVEFVLYQISVLQPLWDSRFTRYQYYNPCGIRVG